MCLLFFIFYHKKTFQKLWKTVFISSEIHISFLRHSMFFFLFFPVSRFKGPDQKINFSKHVLQLKETGNKFITCTFFFIILSIKRDWVPRKKSSYLFHGHFWITYLQKFLKCVGCFGLFTKIKKGYGTSFYCRFSAYLFHKSFPYQKPYQMSTFQYLERVVRWVKTLQLELKGSWFKPHLTLSWTFSNCSKQPPLGHSQRHSLSNPKFIKVFSTILTKSSLGAL